MKKIVNNILQIANSHISVNQTDKGDIGQINGLRDIQYPIVWVDYIQAEIGDYTVNNTLRLYAIDRIKDDTTNSLEIQSDMGNVLEDIIRTFGFNDNYVITPSIFNPFVEQFNDLCSGQYVDVTIQNKSDYDNCINPTTLSTGSTSVTGITVNDYSIISALDRIEALEALTGQTGTTGHLYNFIASGGTIIGVVTGSTIDNITIYSPTASTSSWNNITDKPSWLSGNTLNEFETGHTHNQYLEITIFNNYTGSTTHFYDAEVGVGKTYATINAAYSAGKRKLLVNNNTSLSGDLTVDDNLYIYLDDYTLSANTYNFTISASKLLTIEGIGTITFGYNTEKILFNGNVNVLGKGNSNKTLTITNTSTVANCRINDTGNFSNLIINLPNLNYVGFGINTNNFIGKLDYIYINSGGSSCIPIYATAIGGLGHNIYVTGAFNFIGFYELTNFYANTTGTLYIHTGSNINITAGIIRGIFVIANFFCNSISQSRNGGSYVNGTIVANMSITQTSTIYSNVRFNGSITTDADSNKYIGCIVTGLFTLSSGAEYNVIQGNTLTGGLTNNSGNLTNVINSNI